MFKHLRLKRPLAVVGLETTGTQPATDRVIEIAVLRLDPRQQPVSFVRRVNPGIPVPPAATAVHGITTADVASCPPFKGVACRLSRDNSHTDHTISK